MDWLILILGVPAILIPLVLLFGFAGCLHSAAFCTDDLDCPRGTECGPDGSCLPLGEANPPLFPPQNLVARALDDHSVALTWTNNDSADARFRIERMEDDAAYLAVANRAAITSSVRLADRAPVAALLVVLAEWAAVVPDVEAATAVAADTAKIPRGARVRLRT